MAQFDPTKYGATPSSSDTSSGFNPSKYGAVRLTPPDPVVKDNLWTDIKGIAKELPNAMKQVATEPFKNPIGTIKAITTGIADVGVGAVNITNKIMGTPQLPYLSKAFNDTIDNKQQKDVLGSISEGSKQWASYALGQKAVSPIFNNPIARGVVGDVVGGQIVADPNLTLKERGNQALFDAAFGLITEGVGPLAKKVFGKKEVPIIPKEKLTAEQYSQSQGYEPIVSPDNLPVIKMGKTPKGEPIVKYGKDQPEVFSEGIKREVPRTFEETVQTASPKFKEKVVKQAKILEDSTSPFNDAPLDRTPGRLVRASTKFEYTMEKPNGEQTIKDIISGKVQDPDISPQSAFGLLETRYVEKYSGAELDAKIAELKPNFERVVSKPGQKLGDLRQGMGSESPSMNINKAERLREMNLEKQGVTMESVKSEIKDNIEQALKDLQSGKTSQDIINKLLDDFSC
ncbi:MAG: hypothetical protein HGA35_02535 [Erysipelotrichaceae bacterium]|nr:hypothetical protein [Erysipelotrichaceae bacterium]